MKTITKTWLSKRILYQKKYKLILILITIISAVWTLFSFFKIRNIWSLRDTCNIQSGMNDFVKVCNSLLFGNIFQILLNLLFLYLFLIVIYMAFIMEEKYIKYILNKPN